MGCQQHVEDMYISYTYIPEHVRNLKVISFARIRLEREWSGIEGDPHVTCTCPESKTLRTDFILILPPNPAPHHWPSKSHIFLPFLFLFSIFRHTHTHAQNPHTHNHTFGRHTDGELFGKNRNRNRHRVNKALGKYLERDDDNYGPDHLGLDLGRGLGLGLGYQDAGESGARGNRLLGDEKRKRLSAFRERDEQFGK